MMMDRETIANSQTAGISDAWINHEIRLQDAEEAASDESETRPGDHQADNPEELDFALCGINESRRRV